MAPITTHARRLARQHNNDPTLVSGWIYEVELEPGAKMPILWGAVATYACDQIGPNDPRYGKYAFLRVGHGRLSYADAQRFLDDKGVGW